MAATRKLPPSPVKSGIIHTALAVLTFAALGTAAVFAIQMTGDADTGSPRAVVGLFNEDHGLEQHALKDRLSDDHGHIDLASADHATTDHAPNLGVADPGSHAADPSSTHEDEAHAEEAPDTRPQVAGLPAAPLEGLSEWSAQGRLPIVAADGRTSFSAYKRPFSNPAGRPTISIVVGGLGLNRLVTEAAIDELPPEVTLSFVPYSRDLQGWVDKARAAGHEVLVEMPMEPYDYPNNDTGPYTLLTTANATENLRRTEWLLSRATGYFGVTNYQGAKFATDTRAISPVFEEISNRGLAFIHDGSAPRSVFQNVAEANELPFTEASRVLDSDPSASAIDEQLLQLEAIALQRGYSLGTGFAFPITIDQLRDWAGTLESKGYLLAPASSLPRVNPPYSLSGQTQQASP